MGLIYKIIMQGMLFAALTGSMLSCSGEDAGPISSQERFPAVIDTVHRSVLICLLAENSLAYHAKTNLQNMIDGLKESGIKDAHFLVYYDRKGEKPSLLEIRKNQKGVVDTVQVKRYAHPNSASKEALSEVISDLCRFFPAEEYGLILWSHADNWLPSKTNLAASEVEKIAIEEQTWYTFGEDAGKKMELEELANTLPDGLFQFIGFDCCQMGSIEVAYAMRNKAKFIIGSPAEYMGAGFAYREIAPELIEPEVDLEKICMLCYEGIKAHYSFNWVFTLSLINTAYLDRMSLEVQSLLQGADPAVPGVSTQGLQYFDRVALEEKAKMYDFQQYIERLSGNNSLDNFYACLNRLICYSKFENDSAWDLPISTCCGLSVYIPKESLPTYNNAYRETAWYKALVSN